jgi:hypothetical protein
MSTLFLVASRVALTAALLVPAQAPRQAIDGVLTNGPVIGDVDLRNDCPAFVAHGQTPIESDVDTIPGHVTCRVVDVERLASADGARWTHVSYQRQFSYRPDSSEPPRTVTLLSAALYSATNDTSRWRAVWWQEVDAEYMRSITAHLARRSDGSALVGVTYCVNGTGGCSQEFMRRRGGRWRTVSQAYRAGIAIPKDTYIGKGPGIDLETLRGSFGLYSRTDGNCCPSRTLIVVLGLRNDSLVLRSYQIRPTE